MSKGNVNCSSHMSKHSIASFASNSSSRQYEVRNMFAQSCFININFEPKKKKEINFVYETILPQSSMTEITKPSSSSFPFI